MVKKNVSIFASDLEINRKFFEILIHKKLVVGNKGTQNFIYLYLNFYFNYETIRFYRFYKRN